MDEIIAMLPLPVTPVDRAAMYHDIEYFNVSDKYGFNNGWIFEDWQTPFDLPGSGDPRFQLELAHADARLVGNSWSFMARGLDRGFYGGEFGSEHFVGDFVWAGLISATHHPLAVTRIAVYGLVSLGYAFRDLFKTGNVFQFLETVAQTAIHTIYALGFVTISEVRGVVDFGVSLVKAIPRAMDQNLGLRPGTAAARLSAARSVARSVRSLAASSVAQLVAAASSRPPHFVAHQHIGASARFKRSVHSGSGF